MSTNGTNATKFCTFELGDFFCGVEVDNVQEVICEQAMTRIPLANEFIRGLINLRGQIVTAVDLRHRFGLPPRAAEQPPMNVVIKKGDSAVSLLVDDIDEVVDVSPDTFEHPPDNLKPETRRLIRGVHKFPDRLMLVLDTDAVLSVPERAVATD